MDSEFLTISEAAQRVGTSRISLRRRVDREAIPIFADPLDSRRRLVRIQDVDRLRQPRQLQPTKTTVVCAKEKVPA